MPERAPTINDLSPADLNLTGRKFGNWTVLFRVDDRHAAKDDNKVFDFWMVECDCGKTTKELSGNDLRTYRSLSCGCKLWQRENGYVTKREYVARLKANA